MRFGNFELDPDAYELKNSGQPVKLERIPMELLLLLAGRGGKLLTREEIVAHIWGKDHFLDSESAINTAIRKLRNALGEDPEHPRFIETVPRKGYRFAAQLNESSATPKDGPANPEAMQHYLRGRHYWNKKSEDAYEKAIECYRKSIDADAAFAPAHAGLAYCYTMMAIHGLRDPSELYPRARAAAQSALEIDRDMADSYVVLGDVSKGYEWDWNAAEELFRTALRHHPTHAVAHQWSANLFSIVGRHNEAIAAARAAREADPLSPGTSGFVGFTLYRARRISEARREAQQNLDFNRESPIVRWFFAHVCLQFEQWQEAIDLLLPAVQSTHGSGMYAALLAFAQAQAGETAAAQSILDDLSRAAERRYISPFDLATVYLGLNRVSDAITQLRIALDTRVMRVSELPMPFFDRWRSNPEFKSMIDGLRLPSSLE
jgi:DNA-binding winged helix-turn-helix (wHTH) protein/Flp pilus assembly protein TadD